MKHLLILISFIALSACTPDEHRAKRILEESGYTNIHLDGYPFFACSEDDVFNVSFYATGPTNKPVSGALCCGWMKNCTIRLD